MRSVVRVCDIDDSVLRGPYSFDLARAVFGPFLDNGSQYIGIHVSPVDMRGFFPTVIVDETTPHISDVRGKLMIQGGTQYGCSARVCPFCVFTRLKYYRDLSVHEIIDLYRIGLFFHGTMSDHAGDVRELSIKFTDNGEPFHSPVLIQALDGLCNVFGCEGKVLRMKISSIFHDSNVTRKVFGLVMDWQRRNIHRVSIHLQVSRSEYGRRLIGADEMRGMIGLWLEANPYDRVCIAPGLVLGFREEAFVAFCRALQSFSDRVFFRFSIIKPTTNKQRGMLLDIEQLRRWETCVSDFGFEVEPLPTELVYAQELDGAGTLSHHPDGLVYNPCTYQVWEYHPDILDPNEPI